MARRKSTARRQEVESYQHPEVTNPMRPDVGTQAQFRKHKPPHNYRYDSSLSPSLEWDGQNSAREQGEALIQQILEAGSLEEAKEAAEKLKALGRPFLNWAGKAERLSFDVPTLPLFVHERHSTKTIIETLAGQKRDKQRTMFEMFGDPQRPISDQVLRAYEYRDNWFNRLILGDNLTVMNSLLQYEGLGGQVQMIYMDPPYGVKYGSNFQPFVRKRDVKHNDDEDMTREPEMVQAYRDIWEVGLHSYLTYLRDRLLIARDLLHTSGSIFVQISDENLHHVREVMDEVFGEENALSVITIRKTTSEGSKYLGATADFLLWYGRDATKTKFQPLFSSRSEEAESRYDQLLLPDGSTRAATSEEKAGTSPLPNGSRLYRLDNITSARPASGRDLREFIYKSKKYTPGKGTFKTDQAGMQRLAETGRLQATSTGGLSYRRFKDDFCLAKISNLWNDISGAVQSRSDPKIYVVQTSTSVIERCILMTTEPGDLVLDPTCGSGTTSYVAEQWGRRWITIDISRVPLALTRQRLLTATFSWYELKDDSRGPASGFVYKRKQNRKGEEVGGIVPHVTLKSIANNEPPDEEVLVDRPEVTSGITRVSGTFWVEGSIPTPADWENDSGDDSATNGKPDGRFPDRMLEILRKSPVLRLDGNRTVAFEKIRLPAKTLSLSAEATLVNGQAQTVAFLFGPEHGAISQKLVYEALREAHLKGYEHLYVIGFAIQPDARSLIDDAGAMGVPASYVQATPDLLMGDLLKNMRSSQIFSVCGLPEVKVHPKPDGTYQVELLGLDVFDPATMDMEHRAGTDVPAWFLDTNYNGLCFLAHQVFFPRTGAWDNLKKALKADYQEGVWDHLASTMSTPFEAGEHGQIAVKVIDDRGNELLVVKQLKS
ncbi:hypothetical protein BH23PLA1_BH23PLA1_29540 [soil metagenome]